MSSLRLLSRAAPWLVLAATCAGCGIDEDALICAPGRTRDGKVCVEIVEDDGSDLASDLESDVPVLAEPCGDASACGESYYCDPLTEGGRCRLRCTAPGAPPCVEGAACSPITGICLMLGPARPGESCEAGCDEPLFACADDGEGRRCRLVCDLRDPRTCSATEACEPLPSGAGVCLGVP